MLSYVASSSRVELWAAEKPFLGSILAGLFNLFFEF